jgi:hypothetical protein
MGVSDSAILVPPGGMPNTFESIIAGSNMGFQYRAYV